MGHGDQAARLLQAVAPLVDELPSLRSRYEFLGELGTVLERSGCRLEGRTAIESGLALALQAQDLGSAATMYVNLGINHVYWGNAEAAVAAAEAGLAFREQHDGVSGLATAMQMTLGAMCRDVGRYGDSISHLELALAGFEAECNAMWIVNTCTHLALAWLQLGQPGRAQGLLRKGSTLAITDDALPPFIAARRLAVQGLIERAHGRSALPLLDQALETIKHGDRADARLSIALERCSELSAAAAITLCDHALQEATQHELAGHCFAARVLQLDAYLRRDEQATQNDGSRSLAASWAASLAAPLAADSLALAPSGVYRIDLLRSLGQSLGRLGMPEAAQAIQTATDDWLRRAVALTPPVFKASLMQRGAAPGPR